MTRETIKGLLLVAGLTLLLAAGIVLPLRAAPPPQPAGFQGPGEVTLEITATQRTVTAERDVTLMATIRNSGSITITNVNLTITLPIDVISYTVPLTWQWSHIEPAGTGPHSVTLHIPEQISRTLRLSLIHISEPTRPY